MDIFSFLKSLRSKNRKVPKMIPLSQAAMHMSKYVRDVQNQEPYDEPTYQELYDEPIYICTREYHIGDQIRDECQRRKIQHECFRYVLERSTNKVRSVGYGYIYKIEIRDTRLKTKQMADWAITTFNFKKMLLPPDDILAYLVWIQPMRDVSIGRESYDEDGWPRDVAEHWV